MRAIGAGIAMVLLASLPEAAGGEASRPPDLAGNVTTAAAAAAIRRVRPLHESIQSPGPGDWLSQHNEPGQTFVEYVQCRPAVPSRTRRVIAIQPLGSFTRTQREIIQKTAEFMGFFYNLPVVVQEDIPLSEIPAEARRKHPQWGMDQVLTRYVLDRVLKPRLPDNAVAYIAFTASDLWPGRGWNFVFGEASLRERVGVWSIYRNGDPDADEASYRLCLLRTLKTAVHETSHMFSMLHCTLYECGMCGSNHREESDRRPLWFCPECMAKVCWATQSDPSARCLALADWCKDNGLEAEAAFYRKSAAALGAAKTPRQNGANR